MIVDPLTASAALAALAAAIPSSSVAAQVRLIPSSKAAFACSSYEGASSSFEVAFTLTFLASTKEASSFAKQAAIAATATTTAAFVIDKANQVKESQLLAVKAQLVMAAAKQVPHFKVGAATLALVNYSKIQEREKQSLLSPSQFIIRPSLFETNVIHLDADFQPTSSHLAFKKQIEDQD